jgi:hypothetical protein
MLVFDIAHAGNGCVPYTVGAKRGTVCPFDGDAARALAAPTLAARALAGDRRPASLARLLRDMGAAHR